MSADPLIAVLGADSPVGELLIDALADAGHARRAVLAVNAADIDDDLPGGIVAACADGSVPGAAARLATLAGQGVAALGLNDGGEDGWPTMVAADDPLPSQRLQLASSGWVVLAKLLRPLHAAFGVSAVTASVMQPASERGSAALEILGQQTAAVLNFRDPRRGLSATHRLQHPAGRPGAGAACRGCRSLLVRCRAPHPVAMLGCAGVRRPVDQRFHYPRERHD